MYFSTALIALAATASFVSASYVPAIDEEHLSHIYETPTVTVPPSSTVYDPAATVSSVYDPAATVSSVYDPYHHSSSLVSYTTEVVTAYVTYCPSPTQIVHGSVTYTVTEATTLTISDCPCTLSMPVYTSSVTICSTCYTPSTTLNPIPITPTTPTTPVYPVYTPPASTYAINTTVSSVYNPYIASASAPGPSYSSGTAPPIAQFTGGAATVNAAAGGALFAAAGLVGLFM